MRRILSTIASLILLASSGQGAGEFSARFEEIKRKATKEQLYSLLFAVPKGGDIHNHLGGSNTPEMWYRVATSDAVQSVNPYYTRTRIMNCKECTEPLLLYRTIQKSTFDGLSACCQQEYVPLRELTADQKATWLSAMKLDRPGEGRNEFFDVIWFRLDELFNDAHVTAELLIENMKAFGAEGVRYIETQLIAPRFLDAKGELIPVEESLRIFEERLKKPDAVATGVLVKFQFVVLRFRPDAEKKVEEAFAFVDQHRDRWVGVNMAGREDNDKGYPLRFLETFRKMRRTYSGIGISIHGGEVDEPNQHVRDTLLLGATRIGHGLNLVMDPETLLLMRNNRFLVEINLVSNKLLEYFPDLNQHPFPEYLRTGVAVCLNTDDRGMWDSNMTDEYFTAVTTFNLTWDEMKGMAVNSLEHSFARPEEKTAMLEKFRAQTAEFEARFGKEGWQEEIAKIKPVSSGYSAKHLGIQFPSLRMAADFFKVRESGSTMRREVIAGLTTFSAMAYILAVNPAILGTTGMDMGALVTATALASAIATAIMALMTNYPVALAPGMGLNAFFAFTICGVLQIPWQSALGLVFWEGVLFMLLSLTGARRKLVEAIPQQLKLAVTCGIGLFILFIGLKNGGFVVAHPATFVTLGDLTKAGPLLFFGGVLLAGLLIQRKMPGAILISIIVCTIAGFFLPGPDGGTLSKVPGSIVDFPASLKPSFLALDIWWPFSNWKVALPLLFSLLFVEIFDAMGTLIGVAHRAGLLDSKGNLPRIKQALIADSGGTVIGSLLGTSTTTAFIESSAGVEEGGRTGLTSIVVAVCFLLALFLHPLILAVPLVATAPALVIVGILMMQTARELDWDSFTVAAPAVLTLIVMPLTFSISEGIAVGFISYVVLMLGAGRRKEITWLAGGLAVLFFLHFLIR